MPGWDAGGMQHLLSRAVWDADEVRDEVREAAVEHLGDTDAMLVVDETGDLKKGVCSIRPKRLRRHTPSAWHT